MMAKEIIKNLSQRAEEVALSLNTHQQLILINLIAQFLFY